MIPAITIGVLVLVVTMVIVIATARYLRTPRSQLPEGLVVRRRVLRRTLESIISRVPGKPRLHAEEVPIHPQSASIEAKLIAGNVTSALAEAEMLFIKSPDDERVSLLLARVLIHSSDVDAAIQQLSRARSLGATGPMLDYLEGRAHHQVIARQLDAGSAKMQESPLPSLITPFEMFMLELERHRQRSDKAAALWIASAGNLSLDHDRILELVTEYFTAYCESLEKLTAAAEREPGFSDALYHTARLALKSGFIEQGLALMHKIEPLMSTSPERRFYERDLSVLRGRASADAPPPAPPPPTIAPTAKRSIRLKVLN